MYVQNLIKEYNFEILKVKFLSIKFTYEKLHNKNYYSLLGNGFWFNTKVEIKYIFIYNW